jgi:hypothetical protein
MQSLSSTNRFATQRKTGPPGHTSAQRNDVLRLLREAKARGQGLRRDDAIFQHRITQVGTRIHELERMGYVIRHDLEPGARFVTYFLVREPGQENPLPTYQRKPAAPLTLFDLTVRP